MMDRSLAPAIAALVARLREETPAGTGVVFSRALEAATASWLAVEPGEVLVEDDVAAAGVAMALERPASLVLAFAILSDEDHAIAARAGVRTIAPSASALGQALASEVAKTDPRVLVVAAAG
jgi:hypothetical protein